jgi:hypothetical protein
MKRCERPSLQREANTLATWDDEYGTGSDSDRTQPAIYKRAMRARLRKQSVRQRGTTNTEPGAIATGCQPAIHKLQCGRGVSKVFGNVGRASKEPGAVATGVHGSYEPVCITRRR